MAWNGVAWEGGREDRKQQQELRSLAHCDDDNEDKVTLHSSERATACNGAKEISSS